MRTIFDDAERFLKLYEAKLETADDPIDLLRSVTTLARRFTSGLIHNENVKLRQQLAESEARVSEANGRTRAVEHRNVQLEETLKQQAQRQTPTLRESPSMARSSTALVDGPDYLSDPSFVPCRDERCHRKQLHAVHDDISGGRGPGRPRKKDSSNA